MGKSRGVYRTQSNIHKGGFFDLGSKYVSELLRTNIFYVNEKIVKQYVEFSQSYQLRIIDTPLASFLITLNKSNPFFLCLFVQGSNKETRVSWEMSCCLLWPCWTSHCPVSKGYLGPTQTSVLELFCQNSERLLLLNSSIFFLD